MTARHMRYDDESSIEWTDRETLKYEEIDGHMLLIWVDYEPGFFSRGRVLMSESLTRWREVPNGHPFELSKEKKEEIIAKVRRYYDKRPLRVSDPIP